MDLRIGRVEDFKENPSDFRYLILYDDNNCEFDLYSDLPRFANRCIVYIANKPPSIYSSPQVIREWRGRLIEDYRNIYCHYLHMKCTASANENPPLSFISLCKHGDGGNVSKQAILALLLETHRGNLTTAWSELILQLGQEHDTWEDISQIFREWIIPAIQEHYKNAEDGAA